MMTVQRQKQEGTRTPGFHVTDATCHSNSLRDTHSWDLCAMSLIVLLLVSQTHESSFQTLESSPLGQ